jgi:HK97 family phage prohead protease
VRFLVNHDTSKIPLARSRRNTPNSTMQLTVDSEGLGIRVKLDIENNADARALYSSVQRGDISGMSFMFGIDAQEWTEMESEHPTRHITQISTVVEVSACTFPAYEDTEISARSKEALDNARLALENAKKEAVDTARSANGSEDSELALEKEKLISKFKKIL